MTYKISRALLLAVLLAPLVPASAGGPAPVVVCYPGGPVNERDAGQAMDAMLRVVERVGQWPQKSFSSVFTAKAADCGKLMAEKKPAFAITSLGLYLDMRGPYDLVPVVQPRIDGRTSERYRVVVQKGRFHGMDELKGRSLGGTVLDEPAFIGRIVFAGKFDPEKDFALQPSRQAIRALRSLDKGELDAVMLNEQQFAGLSALQLANPVEAVFTSAEIPLMGVVANGKLATAQDRARFGKALETMCGDADGKKLCDLFGIQSFVAVDPAIFDPMAKLWLAGN
ncbi:sterol transporter periplasmic substrate-binding protein BstB [Methylococcus geothermalis]|uniref:PhnD/SsuA/transferrin family substrate-binding protein n=1 Tax=Methylococcus geothermalis TaxID=2681310 RepID=A0A858QA25_9GAMM|nr:sterol transporter periplasmic substrate-binding protein BstB [Methylococcus geothermalis]QJD30782.1 PhnD/SsuA/transferrin family substrate-binding protein [Methylococcus geothermalis]